MLQNWIKLYLNILNKGKLFFVWNILGLAIGMSSVLLAITYWKSENSYNKWIPNGEQIYELNLEVGAQSNSIVIPAGVGPYLANEKQIDNYCYYALEYLDFYGETKQKQGVINKILNTQKTFFDFFPYSFKYGNKEKVFKEEYSIAISSHLAKQFFGDVNPVGDTLSLAHQKYVIGGVYELSDNATIMPQVVLPNMEWNNIDTPSLWQDNAGGLLLKMAKTVKKEALLADLNKVYYDKKKRNKYFEEKGDVVQAKLIVLQDIRFESQQTALLEGRTNKTALLLIVGCSLLIFLLTILNYTNQNQANVLGRVKEFTLKRVVGASRRQLVCQLLFETAINTLLALVIALVLVELSLPIYNSFLHQELQFSWRYYWEALLFVIAITIGVGGMLPAFFATYISKQNNYKELRLKHRSQIWRMTIVALQLMISFFFLIAGNIIHQQVDYMQEKERGFDGDNVYQVKLYTQQIKRKLYRKSKVIEELKEIEGVQNVALSTLSFKRKTVNKNHTVYYKQQKITDFVMEGVDEDYLKMMGFAFVDEKRGIDEDIPTVIVNESFVTQLKSKADEVLGEVISYEGNTFIIQAVIKDFYRDGFEEGVKPMLLFNWRDIDFLPYTIEAVSIQIDPNRIEETFEHLRTYWVVNVDYEYPFDSILVNDQFNQTFQYTLSQRNMFIVWNIAVLLIAVYGVYAVLSFVMERRLKEIAMRKVLGASAKEIIWMFIQPFLIAVLVAFSVIVYPSYYLMEYWVSRFTYHIDISAISFVFAFLMLTVIVGIVLLFKIKRVLKGNLIEYIKHE
ncbi:MAG: ABC transporter permease [Flavobacteriaceae bacterium]|jgi:putative ABC transport system permease protein|nr:ABC transporter permease [Flavobacteriaceae bacterium]